MIKFNKLLLSFLFLGWCGLSAMEGPERSSEDLVLEEHVCPLCYMPEEKEKWVFCCSHEFCADCLAEWIRKSTKDEVRAVCPMCKAFLRERFVKTSDDLRAAINEHHEVFPCGSLRLLELVEEGDLEGVEALLELPRINVNCNEDKSGFDKTALMIAIQEGHTEIALTLLEHPDISVNACNHFHRTALMMAVFFNQHEIVKALVRHPHINVNLYDFNQWTALFEAVFRRRGAIVRELLQHPAIDVNCYDKSKNTPLMIAASEGYLEIVKALLEHPGIDVNMRNGNGRTAEKMATSAGFHEIALLIREYSNN
ncbi:TPA: hypothetical protein DIC20_02960 [Candidatus Dependentiae bacterium]|nr:MAG: Ankyrin repeat domain-containing protein 44 [candidate division TM6 bacterium GW2011_GWF2_36_131]KKQ02538.1 MAG: Ankyrin repeat domain-containing protein 44 [candidate division TM6 bacterium GW2011_GWE2_36_25]KKQ19284.1 MAG: Ankyrin repeat domain-containing protein 44 [candidate division TM6 bacterium GW2011_GWA2_36_9]HBR70107.1 hypothetical protein [Candidatus Dependentiae bacterium]HCU00635.1 hypothetical protein [Candidatus Dependentiae bacterium]